MPSELGIMEVRFWRTERNNVDSVDTVLGLLRTSLFGPETAGSVPFQADTAPWLALAGSHQILPALCDGVRAQATLDKEWLGIAGFLEALQSWNQDRNTAALQQVEEIAGACAGRVEIMALKGMAFLLAPDHHHMLAKRAISDIDLLVRPDELGTAREILLELGYEPEKGSFVSEIDDHLPMFGHSIHEIGVELHHRIPAVANLQLLQTEGLFAQGQKPRSDLDALCVPSPEDRLSHMIWHDMVQDHGFDRSIVKLRGAVDFFTLLRTTDVDMEAIRRRFAAAGREDVLAAFLAWMALLSDGAYEAPAWAGQGRSWAGRALNDLGNPAGRRRAILRDWHNLAWERFVTRKGWTEVAALARDRQRLINFIRTRWNYLRNGR